MNAFQDDDVPLGDLHQFTIRLFAADEIVAGKLYPFSCSKGLQVVAQAIQIQGIQSLVVVVTVFIPRTALTIYKEVIQSNRKR